MNILEYFSLPKKDQKKLLKNKGCNSYRDCCFESYKSFKRILELDDLPSEYKIKYWQAYISKGSIRDIYFTLYKNDISIDFNIVVQGNCTGISITPRTHKLNYIYNAVSDLYDTRLEYNNLEYYTTADVLCPFLKIKCNDNIVEFVNKYFTIVEQILPICKYVHEISTDGTYEKVMKNICKVDIKRGTLNNMFNTDIIYFSCAVSALYNLNITLNNGEKVYTYEDVAKLWHAYKHFESKYYIPLLNIFNINAVFDHNLLNDITNEQIQEILKDITEYITKPIYAEILFNAHIEYYNACKELEKSIKKKYNINDDYSMNIFFDNKGTALQFSNVPVPEELQEIYR